MDTKILSITSAAIAAFLVMAAISSCSKSDFGMFGAVYVRSDAPFRHYSSLTRLSQQKEDYTLIFENAIADPAPYLVRRGNLYVLYAYGDRGGGLDFFYPDQRTMRKIKQEDIRSLDKTDPCLGIAWLRSDAPMQVSKKEDPEIYDFEEKYRKNVRSSTGRFCDQ